jgi:hypothetical protein
MRKNFFTVLVAMGMSLCTTSCVPLNLDVDNLASQTVAFSDNQDSDFVDSPTAHQGGTPVFKYHYYASIEDLYQGLLDFPESDLEYIRYQEILRMDYTRDKTRVTENEEKSGIFGSFRDRLLTEKTILLPFYRDEELPLPSVNPQVTLAESEVFMKPAIGYGVEIGDAYVSFRIRFFDEALIDEANEKGASWLMSQMEPDGINVYNYEDYIRMDMSEGITATQHMTVYEKEYMLADRSVQALVIDSSKQEEYPKLCIYFVYDDVLIDVTGKPEDAERVIRDITFRKVYLPTNTPLHDEP